MAQFGAFEAKNKFGHLLDLVEQGEDVLITRHGKQVAQLVPARSVATIERARAASQRIRDRAKELALGPFDWEEWKAYRDDAICRSQRSTTNS